MMMSLGMFVFEIDNLVYQELQRRTSWRFAAASRVGARPALQFAGPGEDTISLGGNMLPAFKGNPQAFNTLRAMGDLGEGQQLIAGTGEILGTFVMAGLDETQGVFLVDGVPLTTDFRLELLRGDDPEPQA